MVSLHRLYIGGKMDSKKNMIIEAIKNEICQWLEIEPEAEEKGILTVEILDDNKVIVKAYGYKIMSVKENENGGYDTIFSSPHILTSEDIYEKIKATVILNIILFKERLKKN